MSVNGVAVSLHHWQARGLYLVLGGRDCLQSGRRSRKRSLAGLSRLSLVASRHWLRATGATLRWQECRLGRVSAFSFVCYERCSLRATEAVRRALQEESNLVVRIIDDR